MTFFSRCDKETMSINRKNGRFDNERSLFGHSRRLSKMTGGSQSRVVNFHFRYPVHTSRELFHELDIPVEIPFEGCTAELTQRLIAAFRIPVYVEEELNHALDKFAREQTEQYYNECDEKLVGDAKTGKLDVEEVVKEWERAYKDKVSEYADRKGATDEEVFAAAYHRLVHSPVLEAILQVESSYACKVRDVTRQRDEDVNKMTDSQAAEMDEKMKLLHKFTTEDEINHLAGKHFEEQSMVAGRWGSQLDALRQAQKAEYRAWLMKTLEDHQTNSALQTPTNSPLSQFVDLGKLDQIPVPPDQQERLLEESFTIHLGSQLKQMHNIRIMSADVMRFCHIKQLDDRVVDAPRRLQTALGLYSSDLCGLVIMTDSPPPHYTGLAKKINSACQQSTEFHFPQMEDQLEKIMADVKQPVIIRNAQRLKNILESGAQEGAPPHRKMKESKCLQTGDVYITKHSNLAEVHILFHLMADESSLKSSDINSRHPAILGLRNILKSACSNDVTTLTLPVLLQHDMSEEMTVAWCAKRAELVLKCVKGFMIEMASWGGSELKNIQFLVPQGISEDVFSTLAAMLPSIFRVSNPLKFKASEPNENS